jgi:hypothetical protein
MGDCSTFSPEAAVAKINPTAFLMKERFLERRSLRNDSRYNSGEFNKEFWEERFLHNS